MSVNSRKGFTLVELSLSIAFIATLSILVVIIMNNAVSAYHRGLTLNQINTAGMDLVDDMRTALQSSPVRSLVNECSGLENEQECKDDRGLSFMEIERYGTIRANQEDIRVPLYGAFCTGTYTYVWNSGYFFNSDYTVENVESLGDFVLQKVRDGDRMICENAAINDGRYRKSKNLDGKIKIRADNNEEPVSLLTENGSLALYDLTMAPPVEEGKNNAFYAVSFILGTVQGGINVMTSGDYCVASNEDSSMENFDYCAINKFNFAAQATGGNKK